ncbi:DUF7935 family protein [Sphingobacterium suaedae]|uniref:DUF4760 domain-containing protein n=1 Tax=Sphingobacterium suaedae TaxID=1686402 RepID=A0ABW5KIT8_9SPHI
MSDEFADIFVQILSVTIGVIGGAFVSFKLLWPNIESYMWKVRAISQDRDEKRVFQQLRFAAYERLLLLTARMEPREVMLRQERQDTDVRHFKQQVIADIEREFQHNMTQQLYVLDAAWLIVRELKDNTVALFKNATEGLTDETTVDQYIGLILTRMGKLVDNPYHAAQILLRKDVQS